MKHHHIHLMTMTSICIISRFADLLYLISAIIVYLSSGKDSDRSLTKAVLTLVFVSILADVVRHKYSIFIYIYSINYTNNTSKSSSWLLSKEWGRLPWRQCCRQQRGHWFNQVLHVTMWHSTWSLTVRKLSTPIKYIKYDFFWIKYGLSSAMLSFKNVTTWKVMDGSAIYGENVQISLYCYFTVFHSFQG